MLLACTADVPPNCGLPLPPTDGLLGNYTNTLEDAAVTFQCKNGYVPSTIMIAWCTSFAIWDPPPELLNCSLIQGKKSCLFLEKYCIFLLRSIATVTLVPSIVSETNCPGETISYNCSIISNFEDLHLTWTISMSELMSQSFTYDINSTLDTINNHFMGTSSVLTRYDGEYIESQLMILLQRHTLVEVNCSIADINSSTTTLVINATSE